MLLRILASYFANLHLATIPIYSLIKPALNLQGRGICVAV